MIELLYVPKEPIENYVNITAYEGWRGERREKTKENAARIANDLPNECKYSKGNIVRQLSNAIQRIRKNQTIARFVVIANYGIPSLVGPFTYFPLCDFFQIIALAVAISPPSLLSVRYAIESSRRKILYHEIKNNLKDKTAVQSTADMPTLEDIAEVS